jgi:predicted patatin/cPLA2 family phospholipase
MDFDLLFHTFPEQIIPYDYERYARCRERFEMVTTDCLTGRPLYWEEKLDEKRIIEIVRASSTLPYVCPMAQVDGRLMLDGGIVDSIPIVRAQEQGYEKCIVVLTRNKGYRKKESNMKLPFFIYRKYPELRSALTKRNELYNGQLELVERLEEQGKVVVIRPKNPLSVGRMETNVDKLTALYNEGYACAKELFE